jgi:hypothetical protein
MGGWSWICWIDSRKNLEGSQAGRGLEADLQYKRRKPSWIFSGIPGGPMPSTAGGSPRPADEVTALRAQREASERRVKQLTEELQGLKETESNQAHPRNLVVVKNTATLMYANQGKIRECCSGGSER